MNDRASAAPPVQFLGSLERAALERRAQLDARLSAAAGGCGGAEEHRFGGLWDGAEEKSSSRGGRMKIFGQMWVGVRERLRLRRDDDRDARGKAKPAPSPSGGTRTGARDGPHALRHEERPTRDEVFANYHQLVASGFFSSHAVLSTRHAPPSSSSPHHHHHLHHHQPATSHHPQGLDPQWPLAPVRTSPVPSAESSNNGSGVVHGGNPCTPSRQCAAASAVCSPMSAASSRGTKRAASDVPDESDNEGAAQHDAGEDESTLAHRFLPKRLRITAARDISLPKLTSVASRKNMRAAVAAARRSLSAGAHAASGQPEHREPVELADKGPLSPDAADAADAADAQQHGAASRRIKRPTSARNLRSGKPAVVTVDKEVLSVVPDVNMGIPSVPVIPAKFTYGEDRENDGPWRGLRR